MISVFANGRRLELKDGEAAGTKDNPIVSFVKHKSPGGTHFKIWMDGDDVVILARYKSNDINNIKELLRMPYNEFCNLTTLCPLKEP